MKHHCFFLLLALYFYHKLFNIVFQYIICYNIPKNFFKRVFSYFLLFLLHFSFRTLRIFFSFDYWWLWAKKGSSYEHYYMLFVCSWLLLFLLVLFSLWIIYDIFESMIIVKFTACFTKKGIMRILRTARCFKWRNDMFCFEAGLNVKLFSWK